MDEVISVSVGDPISVDDDLFSLTLRILAYPGETIIEERLPVNVGTNIFHLRIFGPIIDNIFEHLVRHTPPRNIIGSPVFHVTKQTV
jgi:hypothetical protein